MYSLLNWFRNAPPAPAPMAPAMAPARAPPARAPVMEPPGTYLPPKTIPMHETPEELAWRIKGEKANKILYYTQAELHKHWHDIHRAEDDAKNDKIEMEHAARRKAEEALINYAKQKQADADAELFAKMKANAALLEMRSQEPHVDPLVTSFASPFKDLSEELAAARHAHNMSKSMKAGKRRKINRRHKSKRSNKSKSKKSRSRKNAGKRCKQCGMINCPCPGTTCKCKPIAGWEPGKGFRSHRR